MFLNPPLYLDTYCPLLSKLRGAWAARHARAGGSIHVLCFGTNKKHRRQLTFAGHAFALTVKAENVIMIPNSLQDLMNICHVDTGLQVLAPYSQAAGPALAIGDKDLQVAEDPDVPEELLAIADQ